MGGGKWEVYSFDGTVSTGIVCAIHSEHEGKFEGTEHRPADLPIFDIQRMEDTLTFGSALLTRTCRWNPVPRHATALPMDGAASLALVQDWLLQKGLPATEARIAQAFSVDLEDDGQTELLICAQNIIAPDSMEAAKWKPPPCRKQLRRRRQGASIPSFC